MRNLILVAVVSACTWPAFAEDQTERIKGKCNSRVGWEWQRCNVKKKMVFGYKFDDCKDNYKATIQYMNIAKSGNVPAHKECKITYTEYEKSKHGSVHLLGTETITETSFGTLKHEDKDGNVFVLHPRGATLSYKEKNRIRSTPRVSYVDQAQRGIFATGSVERELNIETTDELVGRFLSGGDISDIVPPARPVLFKDEAPATTEQPAAVAQ
jgi:hypothetical protein